MSDALTDISRDNRRAEEFGIYIKEIMLFVRRNSPLEKVESAAENVDAIGRGYWGGRTRLADGVKQKLKGLKAGYKKEWGIFLREVYDTCYECYYEIKALSPFKDRSNLLYIFDPSRSLGDLGIELGEIVHEKFRRHSKKFPREYGNKYLVTFGNEIMVDIEIIQLVKSPY